MTAPATTASSPPAVTHGAALTFETVESYDGAAAPLRLRRREATLLRVIAGVVRLTVGDDERVLHTGDEAIVRAGRPHRIAGVGGEALCVMGFRTAPLP
jgi:mannose-6-phosphate isomerase-like protein (cupin superfamily)